MRDLVYPPVIGVARGLFAALGLKFTFEGIEHIPRTGGAVIASNHVSYLDFTFLGFGALRQHRYIRFMAKDAVFRHPISGPLMRGMHHIPVDRTAGSAAFKEALTALTSGELVGVFPEATISRSFMLKDFKPGAVRMAAAAGVPLITRPGNTFASRVAASLLTAAGLPELITDTWEAYFALALELANDATRRQDLCQRMASQRLSSPLFDTRRFTTDLEQLYERIWAQHATGERESITFSEKP